MNQNIKLATAQALIKFLDNQFVERDGKDNKFFAGCFGIFGHGNVAGIGQALQQFPEFKFYQTRNEQSMVHTAAAFTKMKNRLQTFACTSSIGPGATNMITAAAGATINRLPVLLLPGDIFARRNVAPVLQQLESENLQDISVNDCFKPISKYWDRINRPEQLITSLPEAIRVLTSQADTGTVTIALPQDVQTEVFDFPLELFKKRIWLIDRPRPDLNAIKRAAKLIKEARKPLIISGGGVIYSGATQTLSDFVKRTGIPVAETFAGKGSLHYTHELNLGAAGVTGTPGAVEIAEEADLIIGIGTRYSDFTTASKSAFQNPEVKFLNINITDFDSAKHSALKLVGDAKVTISELSGILGDFRVEHDYSNKCESLRKEWNKKVDQIYSYDHGIPAAQGSVIGALNNFAESKDVIVCAAGSLPGDLHKLWRTANPKGFHLEYGYSCMGYEIAGGLGVKIADSEREVYIMLGDGSYLMMNHEIITSIQENYKLTIILLNNNGYASIGGLSESLGNKRFGTKYRYRNSQTDQLDGKTLPVDFVKNAKSLGAEVFTCTDIESFKKSLVESKSKTKTTVIFIETDLEHRVDGYAWWEVPVAEVSEIDSVKSAYERYKFNKSKQKYYL
ncbi:MAG: 3D-(3,5/4)-trihydroxycyclohexane-1,2-dione acylhydrolase (decyclizing) [Melioribacteraceae bacterium]|nr:3D-(3,5/4)-trihydroxycyclohexane-1,2-dione acylhydrolase (decyclizing) [Melioribacteraceae bacterium]MCF8432377.1 3D-(3,5/4)-trihydroxycyclohexane-1,2-dione acylhydrolase (decyclizing) [Melioribacteraceae bacterium]